MLLTSPSFNALLGIQILLRPPILLKIEKDNQIFIDPNSSFSKKSLTNFTPNRRFPKKFKCCPEFVWNFTKRLLVFVITIAFFRMVWLFQRLNIQDLEQLGYYAVLLLQASYVALLTTHWIDSM